MNYNITSLYLHILKYKYGIYNMKKTNNMHKIWLSKNDRIYGYIPANILLILLDVEKERNDR
jgi:hypothetical protein